MSCRWLRSRGIHFLVALNKRIPPFLAYMILHSSEGAILSESGQEKNHTLASYNKPCHGVAYFIKKKEEANLHTRDLYAENFMALSLAA